MTSRREEALENMAKNASSPHEAKLARERLEKIKEKKEDMVDDKVTAVMHSMGIFKNKEKFKGLVEILIRETENIKNAKQ